MNNLLSGRSLGMEPLEERRLLAITVSTLVDEADGSIVDGDISLRDAIALAPSGETINFAAALTAGGPATITLTLGEIFVNKSISIIGPGASLLTIDASGNDPSPTINNGNGSRIFYFDDGLVTRSNVLVQALSLTGADHGGFAGAIRSLESLTVRDSVFHQNSAANGGAIGAGGPLFVYDSEFRNNHANAGGAIQISASAFAAEIVGSTIRDNDTSGPGGGVFVSPNRTGGVKVTNSLIESNDAGTSGGGISSDSLVNITGSSIVNNHAEVNGGGIVASHSGIVLTQVTVSGNTADGGGGGIFATLPLQIRHSTIADNTANADGNAQASAVGGGIQYVNALNLTDPNLTTVLFHTIVGDNDRMSGVGVSAADDLFSGTAVGAGHQFRLDYSLVERNVGFNQQVSVGTGPSVLGVDPKLGALANNGGPTLPGAKHLLTHALLPGGAAINVGNPAAVAGVGNVPQFDERGTPFGRVLNGRIDLGAVEFATSTLAGDYNRNGAVDAADYSVWGSTQGSTTDLRADGSGAVVGTPDGTVNQLDYSFWKANFGNVVPPGGGAGGASLAGELRLAGTAAEESDEGGAAAVEEAVFGGASRAVSTPGPRAVGSRPIYLNAARIDALVDWLESQADSKASHDEAEVASPDAETESTGDFCAAFDRVFNLLGGDG